MFNSVTKLKVAMLAGLLAASVWLARDMPYLACLSMFFAGALAQEILDWHMWQIFCSLWHSDRAMGMMFLERHVGPPPVRYAPPSIVVTRRPLDPSATHGCMTCDICASHGTQTEVTQATKRLFADGDVTVAKIGTDVHLLCESHEDALTVFKWVEEQILATTATTKG